MPRQRSGFNPFYVLLVVAGTGFCLTACAYAVMTLAGTRVAADRPALPDSPLLGFMDRHGAKLLGGELAVLAAASAAAIATDRWWGRRPGPPERERHGADGAGQRRETENSQGDYARSGSR